MSDQGNFKPGTVSMVDMEIYHGRLTCPEDGQEYGFDLDAVSDEDLDHMGKGSPVIFLVGRGLDATGMPIAKEIQLID